MNELKYKKDVMSRLAGFGWKLQAHEDMIEKFIPDLSFSAHGRKGWIEVKYLPKVPKSLADIKHYTVGQQEWLVEHGNSGGGDCFLLVGTPEEHFVWSWLALRGVRSMPLESARVDCVVSGGIAHVVRALDAVVRNGGRY